MFNMGIEYMQKGLFHGFKLVTVNLDLFYLVQFAVEPAQSYYLAGSHFKVAGHRLFLGVCSWHCKNVFIVDLYHFFIFIIVVDALVRRKEEVIRIPNENSLSQQISKEIRNIVSYLKLVILWKDVVLRYDKNGESEEKILFRITAPHIVSMEFTLKTGQSSISIFDEMEVPTVTGKSEDILIRETFARRRFCVW